MRATYVDEADKTQMTLRDEAKRWQNKYDQLLKDYDNYRLRIEEQRRSLPVAQKEIALYQDKLREAEREIQVKDVEIKVLTNKYNGVREDFSSL